MRSSPVIDPELVARSAGHKVARRLAEAAMRFAVLELDRPPRKSPEPVSESAAEMGRFVAARLHGERVGYTRVVSVPMQESDPKYSRDGIREYVHSERFDEHSRVRPQPRSVISLYGTGYHKSPASKDNFICRFGVFDLEDGGRLVQAVPYEFEVPSGIYEYSGMRGTLRELFGEGETAKAMEEYSRINLGVIEADGSFTELRPFDQKAFGADILPILDRISDPSRQDVLDFQMHDGRIEEF